MIVRLAAFLHRFDSLYIEQALEIGQRLRRCDRCWTQTCD
jgi:hypothetical protein